MNVLEYMKKYGMYTLLLGAALLASCSDDEAPAPENEVEVVTDVTLVFTNVANASDVVRARANDPDGLGVQSLQVLDQITLTSGATYTLTFEIFNNLETPGEDIGQEILEEDHEHQFFFSFSNDAFTSPMGDGNIDTASDAINYLDQDENGANVGLRTSWEAGSALSAGSFRVKLQHQPNIKTSSTGSSDGDNDWDLTFVLNIQ